MKKSAELTLRDHFAGQALQGELSQQDRDFQIINFETLAEICYNIADAMMKERVKNKHIKNN